MTSSSSTMQNSQHCWFIAEGAAMAAFISSSMSSSVGTLSEKLLMLVLVNISSMLISSSS